MQNRFFPRFRKVISRTSITKKILVILAAILLQSICVFAQESKIRFEQKIEWQNDENAFEYKVQVRDIKSGKTYDFETENNFVDFTENPLPAGNYEYRVTALDFLGRESGSTDWTKFEIIQSKTPEFVKNENEAVLPSEKDGKIQMQIDVNNVTEDSKVELINTKTNEVVKGTLNTEKTENGIKATKAEFPKVSEGSWKLKITNPSGRESESSEIAIINKKTKEAEVAKQAEIAKQQEEAEAAKRAEEERIAKEKAEAEEKARQEAIAKAEEEKRLAEEAEKQRQAEIAKQQEEAEKQRQAEIAKQQEEAEKQRQAEIAKQQEEAEAAKRAEEERIAKEKAEAEEKARQEAIAKAEEEKRLAEEAEKQRQAEIAKQQEEEDKKQEILNQVQNDEKTEEVQNDEKTEEVQNDEKTEEVQNDENKKEKRKKTYVPGFFVAAEAGILCPVVNSEFSEESILPALCAKIGYIPQKNKNRFGFEIEALVSEFTKENDYLNYSDQFGIFGINLVYQRAITKKIISLNISAGANAMLISNLATYSESEVEEKNGTYGYVGLKFGASALFSFAKCFIIEVGADYNYIFISEMPTDFIAPKISVGVRW